jgi:hypothetical protein
MADNLGPMAWLFLPENEQVQYLQKIALRAEKPSGPKSNSEKRRKDEKGRKWERDEQIFSARSAIFCCLPQIAAFSNQGKGPHSWGRP